MSALAPDVSIRHVKAERARIWERFCREYPICADYEKRSGREIPVVVLRPANRRAVPDASSGAW